MTVRRIATILTFVAVACRGDARQPSVLAKANDPALHHYDIRPNALPQPYLTRSAGNPPLVGPQPANATLHVRPGFRISVFVPHIEDPRNMALAPNGDIFVAQTGAGRIAILRDANHDGVVDRTFTFAEGLNEPFGLAFRGSQLYVGNTDAVVVFDYTPGQTAAKAVPRRITSLPGGGHSTRNVIFNRAGTKMYVSVGSDSNVSVESDPLRAAITEYNPDGSGRRTFANGLRNPVGLALEPSTGALWTAVNERDALGDDLPPDYITEVRDGAFYGWPFAYIGPNEDPRHRGERKDLVAKATVPSLLIQAHSAALGLAFYNGKMFPPEYRGNAFVALHGSWNRTERTGYKVVSVPMKNGRAVGGYDDFVTGWNPDPNGRMVWGRPVGLLVLPDGSLLVSDDGANAIWRVTYGK